MTPSMKNNVALHNIFLRQIELTNKAISALHEDLQYDYGEIIEQLTDNE